MSESTCLLPPDIDLSPQEEVAILARLGMNQIDSAGPYAIYISADDRRILLHFEHQWDRPFNDLAIELARHGFTRTEVEAARESLYTDH